MKISKSGQITEELVVLGDPSVPAYLLLSERPAIIDAGFSCLGPNYVESLQKVSGVNSPAYLFLTHSHFDHCGAAAYLKSVYPGMEIACSEQAKKVLERPRALEMIRYLSSAAHGMLTTDLHLDIPDIPFEPFEISKGFTSETQISLGCGMVVEVLRTPGHTRDCLSYYVPDKKMLFTSEAAGIMDQTGYIIWDHLVDYDMYLGSLKKLAGLDVETLCLGHGYVFTGSDARGYLAGAVDLCESFRLDVEGLLKKNSHDTQEVARQIKLWEYDEKPHPKQPEPAYVWNLSSRINTIAKRIEGA